MLNCLTFGHLCAHVVSNTFTIELRSICYNLDRNLDINLDVTGWTDKSFEIIAFSNVKLLPSMQIVFDPLHVEFDRDRIVYVVYHFVSPIYYQFGNLQSTSPEDAICIPEWFPKLMFCNKGSVLDLAGNKMPELHINDRVELNKFNFMEKQ